MVKPVYTISSAQSAPAIRTASVILKEVASETQTVKSVNWNGHTVKKGHVCNSIITGSLLALTLILIIAAAGSRNIRVVQAAVAFGIFTAISYTIEKVRSARGDNSFTISLGSFGHH